MFILIVEDECLTREHIVSILKKHNYQQIIEAADGAEALQILIKHRPRLVLTDIRMPKTDGLTFIEQARQLLPESLYIILSGYDMFEYAQKAIRLGVYAYLIKPVREAELISCVQACYELIQKTDSKKEDVNVSKNLMKEYYEMTKRRFIEDLIQNRLTDDSYIQILSDQFKLRRQARYFIIVLVLIDDYSQAAKSFEQTDKNTLNFGLENIVMEVLATANIAAFPFDHNDGCGILIHFDDPTYPEQALTSASSKIINAIQTYTSFTVTVCMGCPVNNLKEISVSADSASDLAMSRLVEGGNRTYKYISKNNKSTPNNYAEHDLLFSLSIGKFDEVLKIIHDTYALALEQGYSSASIAKLHLNIIVTLFTTLENMKLSITTVFGNEIAAYNTLKRMINIQDIYNYYETIISYVRQHWALESTDSNNILMERAKSYINKHYTSDISLSDVAKDCHLSVSHFSKLFKNHFNKSFVSYITEFRIQKALELLNTTAMPVNEIARSVGFQDDKYFHRAFKKIVGTPPGKYRSSIK